MFRSRLTRLIRPTKPLVLVLTFVIVAAVALPGSSATGGEPANGFSRSTARMTNAELVAMAQARGYKVNWLGPRSQMLGFTSYTNKTVSIYSRGNPAQDRDTLAHEVGHVFDVTSLSDVDRKDWLRVRGIETQWWPHRDFDDDQSIGAGDLAECFSHWATGIGSSGFGGCAGTEWWFDARLRAVSKKAQVPSISAPVNQEIITAEAVVDWWESVTGERTR